jgi:hypothetical protein
MIGGVLFLRFAVPGSSIPLRRTMLTVFSLASALMFSQVAVWVSWVHGELLVSVSNDAPADTLVGEIHKVPVNRSPIYMYFPEHGFYCYRISIFLAPRGGPPISASCVALPSVEPDREKVTAQWVDEHTLRAKLDTYFAVEVAASIYGVSNWRMLDPN